MNDLRYEVFVNDGVRRERDMRLPDGSPIVSSPVASTLVLGENDAVLVDPPFTYDQIDRVGDWIERSGKRLAYVYATHGHGDHWFGADRIIRRFPGATAYATEKTIAMMHRQATVGRAQRWDVDFPGLIPDSPVVFEPIRQRASCWRGIAAMRWKWGTPTPTTPPCCTCPRSAWWWLAMLPTTGCTSTCWRAAVTASRHGWRRSISSRRYGRALWLPATRTATCPTSGDPRPDRQYLVDAQRLLDEKPTPREYFDRMLALYPDRLNPGPVWYSALELLS